MKTLKTALLGVILVVASNAHAEEEYPNYVINLDWSNSKTLNDNIVMQCDDSYIPEIELVIPGKPGKDFSVYIDSANITSGKPELGCDVKLKIGEKSATYILNGHGGGCTIEVQQRLPYKPGRRIEPKKAVYDIHDAC